MHRGRWFAAIAVVCIGGAVAYLLVARARSRPPIGAEPASPAPAASEGRVTAPDGWLVYRVASADRDQGALAVAPLADPAAAQLVPALRCERVHMAAGRGVCLAAERGFLTTYRAVPFDRRFQPGAALELAGAPSRVQVSPDGTLAATTVFVTGHSYASGAFSTRTSILDLERGAWRVEDLEGFTVERDGKQIQAPDFNFWGVTFAGDGRTFYATLATGGEVLLVKGDVDARTMQVVAQDVECPSLSPDGRRIAFKHRTGGLTAAVSWRIWVLDLASGERHPLAETRSVDDQVQWLDDGQILYALPRDDGSVAAIDQWVVPADGSGAPRLLLPGAYSAAIHRDPDS
jgi:hypothetical protein